MLGVSVWTSPLKSRSTERTQTHKPSCVGGGAGPISRKRAEEGSFVGAGFDPAAGPAGGFSTTDERRRSVRSSVPNSVPSAPSPTPPNRTTMFAKLVERLKKAREEYDKNGAPKTAGPRTKFCLKLNDDDRRVLHKARRAGENIDELVVLYGHPDTSNRTDFGAKKAAADKKKPMMDEDIEDMMDMLDEGEDMEDIQLQLQMQALFKRAQQKRQQKRDSMSSARQSTGSTTSAATSVGGTTSAGMTSAMSVRSITNPHEPFDRSVRFVWIGDGTDGRSNRFDLPSRIRFHLLPLRPRAVPARRPRPRPHGRARLPQGSRQQRHVEPPHSDHGQQVRPFNRATSATFASTVTLWQSWRRDER